MCVLALLHCTVLQRKFMLNIQKRTKNGNWSCVSLCLCVHVLRVFFTPTPCVPAIGLSHSYWPQCHPSLNLTKHSAGAVDQEDWGGVGIRGELNLGSTLYMMWTDISTYFQRHFQLCQQTELSLLPHHSHLQMLLLLLVLSKYCDSHRKCSTLQQGANSLQLLKSNFLLIWFSILFFYCKLCFLYTYLPSRY